MNNHKTSKFAKVFSLESFLLYSKNPQECYSASVCVPAYTVKGNEPLELLKIQSQLQNFTEAMPIYTK